MNDASPFVVAAIFTWLNIGFPTRMASEIVEIFLRGKWTPLWAPNVFCHHSPMPHRDRETARGTSRPNCLLAYEVIQGQLPLQVEVVRRGGIAVRGHLNAGL